MKSQERRLARKSLDKRLNSIENMDQFARPPKGWIKAIRESLGMTAIQFGARMGVSQPRTLEIEKSEARRTLTLDTLERAAHALNCQLVYTLIPNQPLEEIIEARARALAKKRLAHTSHSMRLEDQAVNAEDEKEQLEKLVSQLIEKSGSELWDVE